MEMTRQDAHRPQSIPQGDAEGVFTPLFIRNLGPESDVRRSPEKPGRPGDEGVQVGAMVALAALPDGRRAIVGRFSTVTSGREGERRAHSPRAPPSVDRLGASSEAPWVWSRAAR